MNLGEKYKEHINREHLFSSKDKLLLAVSGGVDSVVLCELCKQSGYDFIIAHCNFQLRGEESERDEKFVKGLGNKYGVEVLAKKFETEKYAAEKKISIQEAARELRYTWFVELVVSRESSVVSRQSGVGSNFRTFLITAHHADDNNETVLMNFFRGTGLHGLTGIPEANDYIRRPLLIFTKDELIAFAKVNQLDYVEDSSNLSSKYTRNFFRNEIIPAISKVYPQVNENLQDNINRFKDIEKLYQFSVGQLKKKICKPKGAEVHIPVKQLMQYNNRALIYEIIREFGFQEKQVDELIKLADSDSGKYIQSPDNLYRIIRHRHWFIISPSKTEIAATIIIEAETKQVNFDLGLLTIESLTNSPTVISKENNTACIDMKKIEFPLLLRKWKSGDYFYPLGMTKKKKIARFLIDQKASKTEKEKTWVIESNLRIIWVVGQRIDNRFKVSENTTKLLRIVLNP